MRTYEQLTKEEQEQAENVALDQVLEWIIAGAWRFNDELNGDDLQARIDAANEKAAAMQTPWFAHEYIMEAAGEELRGMARCNAEDALYPAEDEHIIELSN